MAGAFSSPHPPIVRWVLLPTLLTLAGALGGIPEFLFSGRGNGVESATIGVGFGLGAAVSTSVGGPWVLRALLATAAAIPGTAAALALSAFLLGVGSLPAPLMLMKEFVVHYPSLFVLPSAALAGGHRLLERRWGSPNAGRLAFLGYPLIVGAAALAAVESMGIGASPITRFFAALGATQALGMAAALRISEIYRGRERS